MNVILLPWVFQTGCPACKWSNAACIDVWAVLISHLDIDHCTQAAIATTLPFSPMESTFFRQLILRTNLNENFKNVTCLGAPALQSSWRQYFPARRDPSKPLPQASRLSQVHIIRVCSQFWSHDIAWYSLTMSFIRFLEVGKVFPRWETLQT
jgi:hypothetical protein